MRTLTYYVGVTLDGFIAGPDDESGFFPIEPDVTEAMNAEQPETVPGAFREAAGLAGAPGKRFDTVLMGRGTYAAGLKGGVTDPYPHLKTYVFSRTLAAPPDGAVTVVSTDPVAQVRALKKQQGTDRGTDTGTDTGTGTGTGKATGKGIWLCGGGKLAYALRDEIDELVLKRYPLVAGAGRPLFDGPFRPSRFTPVDTRNFASGPSVTTYVRSGRRG